MYRRDISYASWKKLKTASRLAVLAGKPATLEYARGCISPLLFQFYVKERVRPHDTAVDVALPCRQCKPCMAVRKGQWTARAIAESAAAARTVFATYTFNPETRAVIGREAFCLAKADEDRGISFGDAYERRTISAYYGAFQRYMKRVRKGGEIPVDRHFVDRGAFPVVDLHFRLEEIPPCRLRYMVAVERHKDGTPHLHAILHLLSPDYRDEWLRAHWGGQGFTKVDPVDDDPKPIRYVVKYLGKDKSRLRASSGYGQTALKTRAKKRGRTIKD